MWSGDGRTSRGGWGGRSALTLIEVLVVIMVIGLLAGLLLPALQSARESARRLLCTKNLREIGLALQSYHADHNSFPTGQPVRGDRVVHQWGERSAFVALLPYIEQRPLYDAMNHDFGPYDTAEFPSLENRTVRHTRLDLFLCPSDGELNHRVNYRFNRGPFDPRLARAGPFGIGIVARDATVVDGLSQTAFVSERVGGNFIPGSAHKTRNFLFRGGGLVGGPFESDTDLIPLCLAQSSDWDATSGRYWCFSGFRHTHYNHNGVPNDRRPSCGAGTPQDWPQFGLHPPRSFHPGLVNVLFGDGHVASVVDSVQPSVWTSLGTHAGRD